MIRVAGLDVGLALKRRTSGLATIIGRNIRVSRERGGAQACAPIFAAGPFQVIAIDGPIVLAGGDARSMRTVERLFASGPIHGRCKPGFSHVLGTGLRLREAAGRAADCLATLATLDEKSAPFPRIRPGSIVEAFPNAFLGVCLDHPCYRGVPALKRGRKFDLVVRAVGMPRAGRAAALARGSGAASEPGRAHLGPRGTGSRSFVR